MSTGAEQELEMIEMSIATARKKVELGEARARLLNNADFKMLILEEYLSTFATALVMRRASLGMQDEASQRFINDQLTAIGHLDQFLRYTTQEAQMAANAIQSDEETREQILAEDVN